MVFAKMTFMKKLEPIYEEGDVLLIQNLLRENPDSEELFRKILEVYSNALNRKFLVSKETDQGASQLPIVFSRDNRIVGTAAKLSMPEAFVDSPLTYGIAAHEIFHRYDVTDKVFGSRKVIGFKNMPKVVLLLFRSVFDPFKLFKDEGKAIYAEWEFLRQIPRERLLQWVSVLDTLKLSGFEKKTYVSMLNDVDMPFEDYLKKVYQNGRYSLRDVSGIAFDRAIIVLGVMSLVTVLGKEGAKLLICPKSRTQLEEYPRTLLQKFCYGSVSEG